MYESTKNCRCNVKYSLLLILGLYKPVKNRLTLTREENNASHEHRLDLTDCCIHNARFFDTDVSSIPMYKLIEQYELRHRNALSTSPLNSVNDSCEKGRIAQGSRERSQSASGSPSKTRRVASITPQDGDVE